MCQMLVKVKMLIYNNGVGAVTKFTPPKLCLQGGVKCHSGGGEKKISARFARHFYPSPKYHPPPRSFPRSAPDQSNCFTFSLVRTENMVKW